MITLTPIAAKYILDAAERGDSEGMSLRLAARIVEDGSIEYAMGFDGRSPDDTVLMLEGVEVLIHKNHQELLSGATLDFVEAAPGQQAGFVFRDSSTQQGCGSGACGSGGCASHGHDSNGQGSSSGGCA